MFKYNDKVKIVNHDFFNGTTGTVFAKMEDFFLVKISDDVADKFAQNQLELLSLEETPVADIKETLHEKVLLPVGVEEFHAWADRIISGAALPQVGETSLKFALAQMLTHVDPKKCSESDAYFIAQLRSNATRLIAYQISQDLKKIAEAEFEAEEAAKKAHLQLVPEIPSEATPITGVADGKVLENPKV